MTSQVPDIVYFKGAAITVVDKREMKPGTNMTNMSQRHVMTELTWTLFTPSSIQNPEQPKKRFKEHAY